MSGFEVHQEEDIVASSRLVRIGMASVLVGAAGVVVGTLLLLARVGAVSPNLAGPEGPQPAKPEIAEVEQTPIWDSHRGEELRDEQRRELEGWSWVDRDAGIARIPIERAMDVVAGESR